MCTHVCVCLTQSLFVGALGSAELITPAKLHLHTAQCFLWGRGNECFQPCTPPPKLGTLVDLHAVGPVPGSKEEVVAVGLSREGCSWGPRVAQPQISKLIGKAHM